MSYELRAVIAGEALLREIARDLSAARGLSTRACR